MNDNFQEVRLLIISSLADCKAHNRLTKAEFTVAQKFHQTSSPENVLSSFSGVFFWFFFAQTKKNNKY